MSYSICFLFVFFFKQKTAYEMRISDWSSDVCSSDLRELPPLLYGKAHPYGIPFTGTGDEQGVTAVTRDDLAAHHRHWLRPDNATIFAVGDTTLAELTPLLEAQFGDWRPPAGAKPAKLFRMNRMARPARIVVIDRPGPQSLILAGQTLGVVGTAAPLQLITTKEVLGGSFVSRLNMTCARRRAGPMELARRCGL